MVTKDVKKQCGHCFFSYPLSEFFTRTDGNLFSNCKRCTRQSRKDRAKYAKKKEIEITAQVLEEALNKKEPVIFPRWLSGMPSISKVQWVGEWGKRGETQDKNAALETNAEGKHATENSVAAIA